MSNKEGKDDADDDDDVYLIVGEFEHLPLNFSIAMHWDNNE